MLLGYDVVHQSTSATASNHTMITNQVRSEFKITINSSQPLYVVQRMDIHIQRPS